MNFRDGRRWSGGLPWARRPPWPRGFLHGASSAPRGMFNAQDGGATSSTTAESLGDWEISAMTTVGISGLDDSRGDLGGLGDDCGGLGGFGNDNSSVGDDFDFCGGVGGLVDNRDGLSNDSYNL